MIIITISISSISSTIISTITMIHSITISSSMIIINITITKQRYRNRCQMLVLLPGEPSVAWLTLALHEVQNKGAPE